MSSLDTDSGTSISSLVEISITPLIPRHVKAAKVHITKFENEIQSLCEKIANAEWERNEILQALSSTETEAVDDLAAFGYNLGFTDKMAQLETLSSFGRQSLYELEQIWDRVECFLKDWAKLENGFEDSKDSKLKLSMQELDKRLKLCCGN